MTLPRVTSLVALTLCASVAQAQSTAPKELGALIASQAAAEALTSCDKLGHKVSVTVLDRNGLARAVEKGETNGFLKIHVEQGSQRILGAALLGVGADEAVHSILDATYSRMPYSEFQRHMRIHPTVSELLPTVLEDLVPLD